MYSSLKIWISKKPFGKAWHKFQINGILFFLFGALKAQSLIPAIVGRNGIMGRMQEKNGIKRLFRLYNNERITFDKIKKFYKDRFVAYAKRIRKLKLAVDWTTLDGKFMLLSISLISNKGRSIPIAYDGYELKKLTAGRSQSTIEEELIRKIVESLPTASRKRITIIADRGFDRPELSQLLISLKVNFVIRVCSGNYVTTKSKEIVIDKNMIQKGQSIDFGNIVYTKSNPVKLRFIASWCKKMKDPWFIITNIDFEKVKQILRKYSSRWEIESMFKSKKNAQVGMSWKYAKLETIDRWLRFAFFITILFQFLADIGTLCDNDISIIKRFTPIANPKRRVFSIYNLALKVVKRLGTVFDIFINNEDELIVRYI